MIQLRNSFKLFSKVNTSTTIMWICFWAVLFILVWILNPIKTIPTPLAVLYTYKRLFYATGNDSLLWNIFISTKLMFFSTLYAAILALIFSYLSVMEAFKPLNRFIQGLRYIPIVAFTLIFYYLFPIGFTMKVALMTFGLLFFFVSSMTQVVETVPKMKYELAKSLGMSEFKIFTTIFVRPTLPSIIDVIRVNIAMATLMLVAVESFSRTEGGIGAKIWTYSATNQMEAVYAYIFIVGGFAMMLDILSRLIKRVAFRWTTITERG